MDRENPGQELWAGWDPDDIEEFHYRKAQIEDAERKGPYELRQALARFGVEDAAHFKRMRDAFTMRHLQRLAAPEFIQAQVNATMRLMQEQAQGAAAARPELFAPIERISLQVHAEICAARTRDPSPAGLAAALAARGIDPEVYGRADAGWQARMRQEQDMAARSALLNEFMNFTNAAMGQATAPVAPAAAQFGALQMPTGPEPGPFERYLEIMAAQQQWATAGQDLGQMLQQTFQMDVAEYTRLLNYWGGKMMTDARLGQRMSEAMAAITLRPPADPDADLDPPPGSRATRESFRAFVQQVEARARTILAAAEAQCAAGGLRSSLSAAAGPRVRLNMLGVKLRQVGQSVGLDDPALFTEIMQECNQVGMELARLGDASEANKSADAMRANAEEIQALGEGEKVRASQALAREEALPLEAARWEAETRFRGAYATPADLARFEAAELACARAYAEVLARLAPDGTPDQVEREVRSKMQGFHLRFGEDVERMRKVAEVARMAAAGEREEVLYFITEGEEQGRGAAAQAGHALAQLRHKGQVTAEPAHHRLRTQDRAVQERQPCLTGVKAQQVVPAQRRLRGQLAAQGRLLLRPQRQQLDEQAHRGQAAGRGQRLIDARVGDGQRRCRSRDQQVQRIGVELKARAQPRQGQVRGAGGREPKGDVFIQSGDGVLPAPPLDAGVRPALVVALLEPLQAEGEAVQVRIQVGLRIDERRRNLGGDAQRAPEVVANAGAGLFAGVEGCGHEGA